MRNGIFSSHPADLNCRPADYESAALPAELEWHGRRKGSKTGVLCQGVLTIQKIFFMFGAKF